MRTWSRADVIGTAIVVFFMVLVLALSALAGPPAPHPTNERGMLCQDEVCFEQQRALWQERLVLAEGHHAMRLAKLLSKWTEKGFPEGNWLEVKYAKIHVQFLHEVHTAGTVWFFNVQGYDRDHERAFVEALVSNSEIDINRAIINNWLTGASM